jgi:hypothetical protein
MRRVTRGSLLLLTILPAACRQRELAAGISDSTFVQTMVELQQVGENRALDSAAAAAARTRVLRARGVTAARLEEAAARLATDPDRAAALLQAIEQRAHAMRRAARPDSAR